MNSKPSEEEIDEVIYTARVNEIEYLIEFFKEYPDFILGNIKSEDGSTALHMAAANGNNEIIKYLFKIINQQYKDYDSKISIKDYSNIQNDSGNTSLMWAIMNGKLDTVKILIEEGECDPFVRNKSNHDAFYQTEAYEKNDIASYLLERFDIEPDDDDQDDPENEPDEQGESSESTSVRV